MVGFDLCLSAGIMVDSVPTLSVPLDQRLETLPCDSAHLFACEKVLDADAANLVHLQPTFMSSEIRPTGSIRNCHVRLRVHYTNNLAPEISESA